MLDYIKDPPHYTQGAIEPIHFTQSQGFNFCLGNVVKYITRAGKKEGVSGIEDLEKAKQYLEFEIEFRKFHQEVGKHEIH